jgi:hypothetical protein
MEERKRMSTEKKILDTEKKKRKNPRKLRCHFNNRKVKNKRIEKKNISGTRYRKEKCQ